MLGCASSLHGRRRCTTLTLLCGLFITLQPILLLFVLDLHFHCPDHSQTHESFLADFLSSAGGATQKRNTRISSAKEPEFRFISTEELKLQPQREKESFGNLQNDIALMQTINAHRERENKGTPLRTLLVTKDLVGPVKNGGIGTAFTELSLALASEGFNVTVLFAAKVADPPLATATPEDKEEKERERAREREFNEVWMREYTKRGVAVVLLPPSRFVNTYQGAVSSHEPRCAYETYLWMAERDGAFDVVHFHDWLGLPFFATLAKRQGLHFRDTLLVVQTHGPSLWSLMGGRSFPYEYGMLQNDFMERRAIENADVLVSPSRFMLGWMQERGWVLPARTYRQFNIRGESLQEGDEDREDLRREAHVRINELVFFGRLETRKGIYLFLDALNILLKSLREDADDVSKDEAAYDQETRELVNSAWGRNSFLITFLGKFRQGKNNPWSEIMKIKREKRWGGNVRIQFLRDRDYNEAIAYLREEPADNGGDNAHIRRIALMPSLTENSPYTVLECLAMGIPFGATDVGGTSELIRKEDRRQVLFNPDAASFARFLRRTAVDGVALARPSFDVRENKREWMEWHAALPSAVENARMRMKAEEQKRERGDDELVSVVITSHNRGRFLRQAVESIKAQTYKSFEIVVTDDASDDSETLRELSVLEQEFLADRRGWKVYRSSNKVGVPSTRNKGAELARGKYLVIMDDDNIAKPHELETFMRVARHVNRRTAATGQPPVDIFTCFSDQFNTPVPPDHDWQGIGRYTPLGGDASLGMLANCFGDTNALMRRDAYLQIGGYLEGGPGFQDWEFFLRSVLHGGRLEVVPEALFWKRASLKDSITQTVAEFDKTMNALSPIWTGGLRLLGKDDGVPSGGVSPVELRNLVLLAQGLLREEHKNKAGEYELANSYSQFSPLQGDLGWYYGYEKDDEPFQPFEYFNPKLKKWQDRNVTSPFFGIDKEEMVPLKSENGTYRPMRRYVSAAKELVEIRSSLRSWITKHCNVTDGVLCKMRLDNKIIWERFAPRGTDLRDDVLVTELNVGSKLDMVVDPLENDWCDSIHFTVVLTQLVQPRFATAVEA